MKRITTWIMATACLVMFGGTAALKAQTPTPVTGISLDSTKKTLDVNGTYQLTASITPNNATNQEVEWSTSDATTVTVTPGNPNTSTAIIKGLKAGNNITITAKAKGDPSKTATCNVTVNAPVVVVTGISLDSTKKTLDVNGTYQLTASITPNNATNQEVEWSTSDATTVTVTPGNPNTSTAIIKGLKAGNNITITAKAKGDPSKTATCNVTVKAAASAAPNFALSVASLEVTAEKVDKKIKVEADANLDWSAVSSDLSWLKISDTRGKGTKEVTISIAENNGGTRERTGTITFQVTGIDSLKRVLTVKQTGTKFEVEITPTGNIPTAGGTVTVKVTSTSKVEMKLQNNNWMKLENTQESAGEILYTFKVATKNSSATPRKVNVELKTKVGGLGRTITFTQNGTFSLTFDNYAFSAVSQRGAEYTITVKSEEPWQPAIRIPGTASLRAGQIIGTESISWIDAVYERLSDDQGRRFDGKIKITVKPNLENYSREAIIDFKTSTGATVDSIHLKQFNIDGKMTPQVAKTLVTGIKLDKQVLTVENLKTVQLTATVTPADATNKTLKWESGDPAIATVSATGQVTILKKGNVIITATATDGSGKSASCAITVKSAVSNLTPGETRIYASDGCVRLALPTAQEVRIYTVSGSLVRAFTAPAGHTSISLLTGAYIVRVGTQTEKVMVE